MPRPTQVFRDAIQRRIGKTVPPPRSAAAMPGARAQAIQNQINKPSPQAAPSPLAGMGTQMSGFLNQASGALPGANLSPGKPVSMLTASQALAPQLQTIPGGGQSATQLSVAPSAPKLETMGMPNPIGALPKPAAPQDRRDQFDLRRERVRADAAEDEKRRMEAIERRLAASGIDDSGILQGQLRTEAAGIRKQMGHSLADIDIGEDANRLAERGLDLQASAQELQRQGMNQQDAQYYAGLSQARFLAQQGLGLEEIRTRLQQQGLDQQNAQFYAAQAHQTAMGREGMTQDVQRAIVVDQMAKIDPSDPNYLAKLNQLLQTLGLGGAIDQNLVPGMVAVPPKERSLMDKILGFKKEYLDPLDFGGKVLRKIF